MSKSDFWNGCVLGFFTGLLLAYVIWTINTGQAQQDWIKENLPTNPVHPMQYNTAQLTLDIWRAQCDIERLKGGRNKAFPCDHTEASWKALETIKRHEAWELIHD